MVETPSTMLPLGTGMRGFSLKDAVTVVGHNMMKFSKMRSGHLPCMALIMTTIGAPFP